MGEEIGGVPDGTTVWSVPDLAASLKATLGEFGTVWMQGEIGNLSKAASGHWYFNLSEGGAIIGCAMWKSSVLRLPAGIDIRTGQSVIARGRLEFYAPQGKAQFIAEKLALVGVGAAELALKRLLEKLFQRGYFDPARKRPLPRHPRRLAVVTSPTGAAVRDILQVLRQRWPAAEVIVVPVRVQGESAPAEIAAALERLRELHVLGRMTVDAIVVGRGGGSAEDLAAFNAEAVADAIYRSPVPVVSAVGHEIDLSIADRVADVRAVTPTEAATLLTPDRLEELARLQERERLLLDRLHERLARLRERLAHLADRPAFRRPMDRVRDGERRLDDFGERLQRAATAVVERQRGRVVALAGKLESLSPLATLGRGYSLTFRDGKLLHNGIGLKPGDRLHTRLASGEIISRVDEVKP